MKFLRFPQAGEVVWGELSGSIVHLCSGAPFEAGHCRTQERLDIRDIELLAPVAPGKIVFVGRNYAEHARELGNEAPAEPLLFLKPPSSLLPPGGRIERPPLSQRVDYEGELAVVIGRRCRHFQRDQDPRAVIFGYTCLNDVTARDLQKTDGQWTRAKGFDTFCPLGPWIETFGEGWPADAGPRPAEWDELHPWRGLTVETRVNGEIRQAGNTRDFIFPLARVLEAITAVMTLEAGDVIATGTPAGVGPLQSGDQVGVRIAGIGELINPVR